MDALGKKYTHSPTDRVLDLFHIFDADKSGWLEQSEIEDMINCGVNFGRPEEKVKEWINSCDADGDGKISLEEFKTLVSKLGFQNQTAR